MAVVVVRVVELVVLVLAGTRVVLVAGAPLVVTLAEVGAIVGHTCTSPTKISPVKPSGNRTAEDGAVCGAAFVIAATPTATATTARAGVSAFLKLLTAALLIRTPTLTELAHLLTVVSEARSTQIPTIGGD